MLASMNHLKVLQLFGNIYTEPGMTLPSLGIGNELVLQHLMELHLIHMFKFGYLPMAFDTNLFKFLQFRADIGHPLDLLDIHDAYRLTVEDRQRLAGLVKRLE